LDVRGVENLPIPGGVKLPARNRCPRCGVAQCEREEGATTTACEQCGYEFELEPSTSIARIERAQVFLNAVVAVCLVVMFAAFAVVVWVCLGVPLLTLP
jgi:uncharacterized protein (DUF983 family)